MSSRPPDPWQPTTILRFIESRESSTQVVLVRTDAGDGYLKAMGNPEGEHALACEWVGTKLAYWFGLPTFEVAIIPVTDIDELPFQRKDKGRAKSGPAFISRSDRGDKWGGKKRQLNRLVNPQDVSRLVVFDTWVRNPDRYGPRPTGPPRVNLGNVFLSEDAPKGKLLLRAIDHTHAFTNGRDIVAKNLGIDRIQNQTVFGCFPEFRSFLNQDVVRRAADDLRRIERTAVEGMVSEIPREWDVTVAGRRALVDFIIGRANFLSEDVPSSGHSRPRILTMLWPQGELFAPGKPKSPK